MQLLLQLLLSTACGSIHKSKRALLHELDQMMLRAKNINKELTWAPRCARCLLILAPMMPAPTTTTLAIAPLVLGAWMRPGG
jgi:NaMN:DMB phosphoribosyltransferase